MDKRNMKEYRAWKGMKARCYSPCNADSTYQRNGIIVCDEWINDFDKFLLDLGLAPSCKHSVDRIDNSKGYSKCNCKWSIQSEQVKNRGGFNDVYHYKGEYKVLKDWALYFGIKYTTLRARIYRGGLSFEDAIKADPYKRQIVINGESRTLKEWCCISGVKYSLIVDRVRRGKDAKEEYLKEELKLNN